MVGLPEYGYAAVARDSIQCLPECNSTNKFGASFETPCGRLLVIVTLLLDCIILTFCIYIVLVAMVWWKM